MNSRNLDTLSAPQKTLLLALIVIVGFAVYSNTFSVPFVFDDHEVVEENTLIRSLGNFTDLSGTRYLALLSFALNYAAGGLDVQGYHIVNIAIHALNAFLVFMLVDLAFRTRLNGSNVSGIWPALAASFLFLVHPIQTQAVTYIAQRIASLAALFYLLSIVMYFKARVIAAGSSESDAPAQTGVSMARIYYALSLVSAVAAQKTKEISFTLPFVIILIEFVFFTRQNEKPEAAGTGATKSMMYVVPFFLTLLIIPATLYFQKQSAAQAIVQLAPPGVAEKSIAAAGADGADIGRLMKEELAEISRHDYLATEMRVIVTYLRLIVLPVGQNLDYDYPVFRSFFVPQVYLSMLFLAFIFASGVYILVRARAAKRVSGVLIGFGIIFFFVALSIESSVIPISDVIFEHRLYLPSAGAFIALSGALYGIIEVKPKAFVALTVIVVLAVAGFSIAAYSRNRVWADELTLMLDVVRKSPEKARAYNNVALGLAAKGREAEAIPYLEKVALLEPGFFGAYNNIGNALVKTGRTAEAERYFRKTIELKPDYWKAHYNLGLALAELGRYQESVAYLQRAVEAQPRNADLNNNLANAMLLAGRTEDAIRYYEAALKIDPYHANAALNLENARKRAKRRR